MQEPEDRPEDPGDECDSEADSIPAADSESIAGPAPAPAPAPAAAAAPAPAPAPSAAPLGAVNWSGYAALLLAAIALFSALRWALYPVFIDTYYHMAVIDGFARAGGVTFEGHWDMAPGGRVHIYPPAIHVIGAFFAWLGISGRAFVTAVSWLFYPLSFLVTWLWVRGIAGPRAAFFAIVLLCGPGAWFWNQSAHTANALVMLAAPLALLALERRRFLACGVLNLVAIAAHPMGLFLPPALVVNALLGRKRLVAGLGAASLPVVLYSPWLAHVWANRAFIREDRLGGSIELGRFGVNLGLILAAAALVGLVVVLRRRKALLGTIGPFVGFAVALPMGFGGRFFTFNLHWPLAALGGVGLGWLLEVGESRARLVPFARAGAVAVAFLALATFPRLDLRFPPPGARAGGPPAGPAARAQGAGSPDRPGRPGLPGFPGLPDRPARPWRFSSGPSALARLLDSSQGAPSPRAGPGPGAFDPFHQPGAAEFFRVVCEKVAPGEVIHVPSPPLAAMVGGMTGRPTSDGILADVAPFGERASAEECAFAVVPVEPRRGPFGRRRGPGRGGGPFAMQRPRFGPPAGFEKVFENEFGALWRNPDAKASARVEPDEAVLPRPYLLALAGLALALLLVDLLGRERLRESRLLVSIALLAAAGCLFLPAAASVRELLHPPQAPAHLEFGGPRPRRPREAPRLDARPEPRAARGAARGADEARPFPSEPRVGDDVSGARAGDPDRPAPSERRSPEGEPRAPGARR